MQPGRQRGAGSLIPSPARRRWPMPREPDYEVGYKKPPTHSQFKKGQSGNPRGRPRRAKNLGTILGEALDERVPVTENGRHCKITKADVMLKQLVNPAAQGEAETT